MKKEKDRKKKKKKLECLTMVNFPKLYKMHLCLKVQYQWFKKMKNKSGSFEE